ncbi:MAG TPA: hypothetical protein VJW20_00155 [Candidatus Angelobacter sp.]|nr:hypothetical protein [Candidatus Angelobacter sp.]
MKIVATDKSPLAFNQIAGMIGLWGEYDLIDVLAELNFCSRYVALSELADVWDRSHDVIFQAF